MERALGWRKRAFLLVGIGELLITLSVDMLGGLFDQKSDPDFITAGAWLFMAVDLAIFPRVLFSPPIVGAVVLVWFAPRVARLEQGRTSLADG